MYYVDIVAMLLSERIKVGVRKLKQLEAAKQISDSNSLPKKEENGRMELQMVGSD